MQSPSVVFFGDFSTERISWDELGKKVGWKVCHAASLESLRKLRSESEVVAVFADSGCRTDFPAIKACSPDCRLVVCYPLSAPIVADELVAVGAFHSVPRPLSENEVQQSLGFVWEAWNRRKRFSRSRFSAA